MTLAAPAVPTGNTYDKYGSTNPVVRRLMAGFERTLDELFTSAAPASRAGRRLRRGRAHRAVGRPSSPTGRIVGIDLEDPKLAAEWATRPRPNLEFRTMAVEHLEFADGEFELVAATEVLEHVTDPELALAEMARVAGRHLLVSVPHEPLWRGLNMARGAYIRQLGNTPGHLNHWTRGSFVSLLAPPRRGGGGPRAVSVDDAARRSRLIDPATVRRSRAAGGSRTGRAGRGRPRRSSFASGARILIVGIASTGHLHLRLPGHLQPRAGQRRPTAGSRCAGRSCS